MDLIQYLYETFRALYNRNPMVIAENEIKVNNLYIRKKSILIMRFRHYMVTFQYQSFYIINTINPSLLLTSSLLFFLASDISLSLMSFGFSRGSSSFLLFHDLGSRYQAPYLNFTQLGSY